MTRIWRLDDYTPYDNTVYDEKYGRKTFFGFCSPYWC